MTKWIGDGIAGWASQLAWGAVRELGLRVPPPRDLRRRLMPTGIRRSSAPCPDGPCF